MKWKCLPKNTDKKDESPAGFVGFATAKGTKIKISEDSLVKAKAMLDEEKDPNPKRTFFPGFQTCNGKAVKVSNEALKKAGELFNDDMETIEKDMVKLDKLKAGNCEVFAKNSDPNCDTNKSAFVGFATAKGSKIKISEDALAKAKAMLDEVPIAEQVNDIEGEDGDLEKEFLTEVTGAESHSDKENITGQVNMMNAFVTGNGKKIQVSDEALKKAGALFEAVDIDEFEMPLKKQKLDNEPPSKRTEFCGFRTSSGKAVNVSKEALKKAEELFKDQMDTAEQIAKIEPNLETEPSPKTPISRIPLSSTRSSARRVGLSRRSTGFRAPSKIPLKTSTESQEFENQIGEWMDQANL